MSLNAILYGGPYDGEIMYVLPETDTLGLSMDLPIDRIPVSEHQVYVYELEQSDFDNLVFSYRYTTTFGDFSR